MSQSMMAPTWWDNFDSPKKEVLESRLLAGVAQEIRKHGLEPRITSFKTELQTPWDISLDLVVCWAKTLLDPVNAHGAQQVRFIAYFQSSCLIRLVVEAFHRGSGEPDDERSLLAGRDAALYGLRVAAALKTEQTLAEARAQAREQAAYSAPPEVTEPTLPQHTTETRAELLSAMTSLGFPKKEAQLRTDQALAKATPGTDLQGLITLALRKETPPR